MEQFPQPTRSTEHEFVELDATAQAELVRTKQVSPLELVDAAIARIERHNPAINAVIWDRFDAARVEAGGELPDGPFRGVPFLLKDIGANQAGLPYYAGTRALKAAGHASPVDSVLGARFRAAGLITLGKTNLPELGSCPTTQPLSYGPTKNPWDLARSPAGSSGGSAAAVASGMVAIAHANDGGGSTRLPAAWCGLVGLKPTRGRVPNPTNISRLTAELVVSRTVRDTARMLDAVHGATDADLYFARPTAGTYTEAVHASVPRLRVAVLTDGGEYRVDPACVEGAMNTAAIFEAAGHDVETVTGNVLFGGDGRVNGRLWMAGLNQRVAEIGEIVGRPLTQDDVEPYNWAAAQRGRSISAAEWTAAQDRQQAWARGVFEWMAPFDLLITPTAGCPPLPTDELWPDNAKPWTIGRTYGLIGRFTLPFNATGHPAISLPLHQTVNALPVGVQLVAKMHRDDLLLAVAAWLEEAHPFAPLPLLR